MSDAVDCAGCGEAIPGIGPYVGEREEARHLGCLPPRPEPEAQTKRKPAKRQAGRKGGPKVTAEDLADAA